ncbi:MAG: response regulator [Betaproteobacteria bacterium]|nr:response regulator [Betaproteobacteria bacterium]
MARILVVDDEIGICELLKEALEDTGHHVTAVQNARAARDAYRTQRLDLILLDIWIPDTDGMVLLKEWAKSGKLEIPVIVLSGAASVDLAVEATRLGALDFLEKPIGLSRLLNSVQRALELHPPRIDSPADQETLKAARGAADTDFSSYHSDLPFREAREAFERGYFDLLLHEERLTMTRLAARTGLDRTHLYRKLQQLGIKIAAPKITPDPRAG